MINQKKRVLLYLGKFPAYGFDVDGGSILAKQLIDTLKDKCCLDVVFIRKNKEEFSDKDVNSIGYVEYKDAFNNKFIRRMKNLSTNELALKNYRCYDLIITAHISKFFGMEKYNDDFWGKTILFPMFCTPSYLRAGEVVPSEYTEQERLVLSNVKNVITPSESEANDLVNFYKLSLNKITIIPRGINPVFTLSYDYELHEPLRIVYIGSIKPQKNTLAAVKLLVELKEKSINCVLHLIGTVQDTDLYRELQNFIEKNRLQSQVFFHHELSQSAVASVLKEMDVNISVSHWETFGRGIYEGISAGLPTFLLTTLECTKTICGENLGVVYCNDITDMAKKIALITNNPLEVGRMRQGLNEIRNKVSYVAESQHLLNYILSRLS